LQQLIDVCLCVGWSFGVSKAEKRLISTVN